MKLSNHLFIVSLVFLLTSSSVLALTIGVTAGPHADIMEEVKKEYEKRGFKLKILEFNDFILPNAALSKGDIEANSYQHLPFLESQIKDRGYQIVSISKTITLPLGMYSAKHKTLETVPVGGKVSIPNDPTNGSRALLLMRKAGLLELKNLTHPTILDISKNTKNLKIIEIEAPQLPRTLADVDLSVINTDWVLIAKLDPNKALITEDKDSPYANIIVVRKGDETRADIQALISVYQSKPIREFILARYKGAILPAW